VLKYNNWLIFTIIGLFAISHAAHETATKAATGPPAWPAPTTTTVINHQSFRINTNQYTINKMQQ
jgi:hypothetical protein